MAGPLNAKRGKANSLPSDVHSSLAPSLYRGVLRESLQISTRRSQTAPTLKRDRRRLCWVEVGGPGSLSGRGDVPHFNHSSLFYQAVLAIDEQRDGRASLGEGLEQREKKNSRRRRRRPQTRQCLKGLLRGRATFVAAISQRRLFSLSKGRCSVCSTSRSDSASDECTKTKFGLMPPSCNCDCLLSATTSAASSSLGRFQRRAV